MFISTAVVLLGVEVLICSHLDFVSLLVKLPLFSIFVDSSNSGATPPQLASVSEYKWEPLVHVGSFKASDCTSRGGKVASRENPQWSVVHTGWVLVLPPRHANSATGPCIFVDTSTQGMLLVSFFDCWFKAIGRPFGGLSLTVSKKSESVVVFPRDFWSN